MREVKHKSVIPVYGVAVVWALYCLIFPLYATWHFIVLACAGALCYVVLSAIFPGKTVYVEAPKEPVRTGNGDIDALLLEGERVTTEMRDFCAKMPNTAARRKLTEIITVTDKIFKDLIDDPDDYKQVRRFSELYLPPVIKLLGAYDRFGKSGVEGENISGTLERIDNVLDTILESYKRFFDSLFENQALDIETDIRVLESVMKKEGFLGKDF